MKAAPLHHGSAAHAAAAQRAEHDPRHASPHGPNGPAGTGRGQFGGYVFRLGRAPAPPTPRRAGPLRPRRASRQMRDEGHEPEHDPLANAPGALDDERWAPVGRTDDMPDGDGQGEPGGRDPRAPWQVRMRPEPAPSAETLEARLQQVGGSPAQALCKAADGNAAAEHSQALIDTLLAMAGPATGPGGMRPPSEALRLTAVRAYLQHRHECGAFATLDRVKQQLLGRSTPCTPGTHALPASEQEQDRRLLLPLVLLNADRPRTHTQRDQACDRIELIGASRHMQREHP